MNKEEIINEKINSLKKELEELNRLQDTFDRLRCLRIRLNSKFMPDIYLRYLESNNSPFEGNIMTNISSYLEEETINTIRYLIIADITPKIKELRKQVK